MKNKLRLIQRLKRSLRKTSPYLLLRFVVALIFLSPVWVWVICLSIFRSQKWRRVKTCRNFMNRHLLAFPGLDLSTLAVEVAGGGISNLSLIWKLQDQSGRPITFFTKVFLPLGTFWANASPIVSPAPAVYGSGSRHRFVADLVSRSQLAELNIPVPRLITFDAVEKVMVTQFLEGEMSSYVLERMQEAGETNDEAVEMMRQCGRYLGKVHAAGFSLIDIQPSNCFWVHAEKKIYFTDLEFCTRQDFRVWDNCYFLSFLTVMLAKPLARRMKDVFMEGYHAEYKLDDVRVGEMNLLLREYLPVFETIMDLRRYKPDELINELLAEMSPLGARKGSAP